MAKSCSPAESLGLDRTAFGVAADDLDLQVRQWQFAEPYVALIVRLKASSSQIVVARWHGAAVVSVGLHGLVKGRLVQLRFVPEQLGWTAHHPDAKADQRPGSAGASTAPSTVSQTTVSRSVARGTRSYRNKTRGSSPDNGA